MMAEFPLTETAVVLSENPYLFRYKYHQSIPLKNFYDTGWFDPHETGQHQEMQLLQQLENGVFTHVYLDGSTSLELRDQLLTGPLREGYVLAFFERHESLSNLVSLSQRPVVALFVRHDLASSQGG